MAVNTSWITAGRNSNNYVPPQQTNTNWLLTARNSNSPNYTPPAVPSNSNSNTDTYTPSTPMSAAEQAAQNTSAVYRNAAAYSQESSANNTNILYNLTHSNNNANYNYTSNEISEIFNKSINQAINWVIEKTFPEPTLPSEVNTPNKKILKMEGLCQKQIGKNSCYASCTKALLGQQNIRVNQNDITQAIENRSVFECNGATCAQMCSYIKNTTGDSSYISGQLNYSAIHNKIDNNCPVIMSGQYSKTDPNSVPSQHAILCFGYEKDEKDNYILHVYDPFENSTGKLYYKGGYVDKNNQTYEQYKLELDNGTTINYANNACVYTNTNKA
ncbi:MAG: C39 family peptidase [Oscillospiraceae bacterium]|nr:C39 family peptidase [Oscillospiraceae bacterium]